MEVPFSVMEIVWLVTEVPFSVVKKVWSETELVLSVMEKVLLVREIPSLVTDLIQSLIGKALIFKALTV
jgi:hypothetical protein